MNGGDFGAKLLSTTGGFVKTVMLSALKTGDTHVGFIHVMGPWGFHKYSYKIVPAQGIGADVDDFTRGWLNEGQDKAVKDEDSALITAWWPEKSYARSDAGEPYQKKGSCKVSFKYVGKSDKAAEDFDQYDEYEGKDTVSAHYRENFTSA